MQSVVLDFELVMLGIRVWGSRVRASEKCRGFEGGDLPRFMSLLEGSSPTPQCGREAGSTRQSRAYMDPDGAFL